MDSEFSRQLARSGLSPANVQPRELATIRVELRRVLDLRDADTRDALGVSLYDLMADNPSLSQEIGEAAQHLGYEAIVAPSAAGGPGHVVALFMTNRSPDSSIEVISVERYMSK